MQYLISISTVPYRRRTPASAGARNGVKGNGTISLRALRCIRKLGCCQTTRSHTWDQPERSSSERQRLSSASEPSDSCEVAKGKRAVHNSGAKAAAGYRKAVKSLQQPNVKHQRARAEVSRVKDELSLRALRCMR